MSLRIRGNYIKETATDCLEQNIQASANLTLASASFATYTYEALNVALIKTLSEFGCGTVFFPSIRVNLPNLSERIMEFFPPRLPSPPVEAFLDRNGKGGLWNA